MWMLNLQAWFCSRKYLWQYPETRDRGLFARFSRFPASYLRSNRLRSRSSIGRTSDFSRWRTRLNWKMQRRPIRSLINCVRIGLFHIKCEMWVSRVLTILINAHKRERRKKDNLSNEIIERSPSGAVSSLPPPLSLFSCSFSIFFRVADDTDRKMQSSLRRIYPVVCMRFVSCFVRSLDGCHLFFLHESFEHPHHYRRHSSHTNDDEKDDWLAITNQWRNRIERLVFLSSTN